MTNNVPFGIEQAYRERIDLLVVALTGRTGSGCSTAAEIFTKKYSELSIPQSIPSDVESRKLTIAQRYCGKQWVPFRKITVSTVIFGFLLFESNKDISEFLQDQNVADLKDLLLILDEIRSDRNYLAYLKCIRDSEKEHSIGAWEFYCEALIQGSIKCKSMLGSRYAAIFQKLGDNIRYSGTSLSSDAKPDQLFTLIRHVKRLAKSAFIHDRKENKNSSTRIVIDAVRNPLELVYLRDQFAAFYAIAITADDNDRIARLEELGLEKKVIKAVDEKEYPENKKHLDDYESFVSQNLQDCIQKADIFFENSGRPDNFAENIRKLNAQIIRYTALILRPGLITPTRNERCMQLAFVARANSGCISRQVGAAVADENYSIKAVGWNDVPKGQVPCLLRDVDELMTGGDEDAFSTFEKIDKKLKTQINKTYANRANLVEEGLPCPYCFKSEYNRSIGEKNQVHTRSLHAEENAFLQLAKYGNSGIKNGYLYTTASPCELCSKKAFQLGILEIIYVDPYPGISISHVLSSGNKEIRPRLCLFSGAIGNAYHRLYDPMLSIKDEYMARLSNAPQISLV